MTEIEKKKLEVELEYKKGMLEIEDAEINEHFWRMKDYMNDKFEEEDEQYVDRFRLRDDVRFLGEHLNKSIELMNEIEDLKSELNGTIRYI